MSLPKKNLAAAYRILSHLHLDDHTYTHLSARSTAGFYLPQFGYRFNEINETLLVEVDCNGSILNTPRAGLDALNITGHIIHSAIYKTRPDIQAVFHLHTPAIVAVSAMQEGLLPISQWALHFYGQINYHEYGSLALQDTQGDMIAGDLADKMVLMLRNHGVIICGRTIPEALFYVYHLQKACETQCLALAMNRELILLDHEVCQKTTKELLSFEKDLGARDWKAWVRYLESLDAV